MNHHRETLPRLAPHYDIREIDEDLYLAVLACRLGQNADPDSGLEGTLPSKQVTGRD